MPTEAEITQSELAGRRLKRKSRRLSYGFKDYGYIYADGEPIPPEYLVRVTSYRNNCTIIAPLQEAISLNVESLWEPIIPTSILRTPNIAIQATSGGTRSAITSSTTRRLWSGTSPISITLRMKFEAVRDPYEEVVEPGRLLQTMAVPSDPAADRRNEGAAIGHAIKGVAGGGLAQMYQFGAAIYKVISDLPALTPPGPSPFVGEGLLNGQTNYTDKDKNRSDIESSIRGGDFIMVELGTFLTFWNVIVREGGVNYDIKFSREGYPISAQAEIRFETYEMPTKESLEYSYTRIIPSEPD